MDFKHILEHHILDHPLWKISLGGLPVTVTKHLLMLWIASAILMALLTASRKNKKLGLLVETVAVAVRDQIVRPSLGHAGDRYLHYFLTLFFFIFVVNLLGMVPGAATATGNIGVTATLALCTFCLIHIAGVREQGLSHYLKSIVPSGLPGWLVPLMFPIELIGFITKTFALSIRLFMNMIAGHIVILAFIGLIFIFGAMNPIIGYATAPLSVVMALFIHFLELAIVVPLQAFIFTFLTALFVGAAVHPEH